ncbi:DUF2304 domain-containing protein [Cohnella candidum]|uniref:DUF2304 domain-containing protein n=1 Tax=Cohnella candidum TaxID=2674991 RepID=A0A3G3JT39_9BACL|nr:DUF2304 domain-containing protein [Cohnella candidum]AYQ71388.1 DUF2304 domain-containing protein [Cohnella candidum]
MGHLKLQIFILIILAASNLYIVNSIRKNILELRHALLWILLGITLIVFVFFPGVWKFLAHFFGIIEPVNMLFLFAIFILFAIVYGLMMETSKLYKRNKMIAQELAKLKYAMENWNIAGQEAAISVESTLVNHPISPDKETL